MGTKPYPSTCLKTYVLVIYGYKLSQNLYFTIKVNLTSVEMSWDYTTPAGSSWTLYATTEFNVSTQQDNRTSCPIDAEEDAAVATFHLTSILLLACICIIGNTLVIIVMTREKSLNSPLNYFITSLAASDLAQGTIYAIYNISHIDVDVIRYTLGSIRAIFHFDGLFS